MGENTLNYQNKEWLYDKYQNEKLPIFEIARLCKISRWTTRRWLNKLNINLRPHIYHKRHPDIKLICPICKKEFYVMAHDKNIRKYCSCKCWLTNLAIYQRKKIKNGILDKDFYINSAGYISRFGSEGRGYHREIMEDIIGRKIKKNECVHHIDLDKKNINKNNLLLMPKKEHQRLHWQLNYIASELLKKGIVGFDIKNKEYFISEGGE